MDVSGEPLLTSARRQSLRSCSEAAGKKRESKTKTRRWWSRRRGRQPVRARAPCRAVPPRAPRTPAAPRAVKDRRENNPGRAGPPAGWWRARNERAPRRRRRARVRAALEATRRRRPREFHRSLAPVLCTTCKLSTRPPAADEVDADLITRRSPSRATTPIAPAETK